MCKEERKEGSEITFSFPFFSFLQVCCSSFHHHGLPQFNAFIYCSSYIYIYIYSYIYAQLHTRNTFTHLFRPQGGGQRKIGVRKRGGEKGEGRKQKVKD